jgi:hypothetical protein
MQKLSTEVIADFIEYPEVQRRNKNTVKATPYFFIPKTEAGTVDIPAGFSVPSSNNGTKRRQDPCPGCHA